MWQLNGVLLCDAQGCSSLVDWGLMPHVVVMQRARAIGWHCYEGPNYDGSRDIISHLCPRCVGTARSKLAEAPPALEEDVPLFEMEIPNGRPGKRYRRLRGTGD